MVPGALGILPKDRCHIKLKASLAMGFGIFRVTLFESLAMSLKVKYPSGARLKIEYLPLIFVSRQETSN